MRIDFPSTGGTLAQPLSKIARTIQFNAELEEVLSSYLLEGNWTYFLLRNQFNDVEIVKISIESGFRVLYRGQDFTEISSFNIGDSVEYVFTSEHAFIDIPDVSIGYAGAIVNTEEGINYQVPYFEHYGAAEVVSSGDSIILGRNTQAYGCCDTGIGGAVAIPEPYIYLTSRMYPHFEIEQFQSDGNRYSRLQSYQDTIELGLQSLGQLYFLLAAYGGALSHTQPPQDAIISTGVNYLLLVAWGGAIAFEQPVQDAVTGMQLYMLLETWGGAITHNQPPQDAITAVSVTYTQLITS